jgi:hypothetical protein
MVNRTLLFLVLSLGYQILAAQEQVDCKYVIDDAREAYEAGMLELVPDLLNDCIKNNGLTGELRKEAYKLVINSYLFDYKLEEADTLMYNFVHEFPDYMAENSDPQEFVSLLNSHMKAMSLETEETPEDTVDIAAIQKAERKQNRINSRRALNEFGNTVGFHAGSNFSVGKTLEGYSVGDPAGDQSHFGLLPGIILGGEGNLILNMRLEASIGLLYNLSRYSYKATPLSFTSYRYTEAQHQLLVPLSILYKLNPENRRYCYYLKGGIVPGYLLRASGSGTRSYDAPLEDVVVDRTNITESRNRFNLDILIGGGMRIPLKKAFFFLETFITSDILRANRAEGRYQNNDLTWLLYHVDSDFRVFQLSVSGGLCWDLTKQ